MMHPSAAQVLIFVVAAVMLVLLLILQTRRASRLWLRVFPRVLRNRLSPYLEPRPAVHPHLFKPDEIPIIEDDAPAYERFAATILRAYFSALHGIADVNFYIGRFVISFIFEGVMLVARCLLLELHHATVKAGGRRYRKLRPRRSIPPRQPCGIAPLWHGGIAWLCVRSSNAALRAAVILSLLAAQ
jgi:hypothetical protein